jgi:hypothetical protein
MARRIDDSATVQSLDLSFRNFITVHVKTVVRRPILPRDSAPDSIVQPILTILHCLLRDVTLPIREFLLRNPACLPDLVASVSRGDPSHGSVFSSNPQLLLSLFGITPDEFLEALNRVQPPPAPEPTPDPVGEFIDGITHEDLLALERVMTADVTLDVALPIFIEQNKDVAATIEQINRMRREGGRT